jgi:hypothetical protein
MGLHQLHQATMKSAQACMAHGDQDFVGAVGCKSLSFPEKKNANGDDVM